MENEGGSKMICRIKEEMKRTKRDKEKGKKKKRKEMKKRREGSKGKNHMREENCGREMQGKIKKRTKEGEAEGRMGRMNERK